MPYGLPEALHEISAAQEGYIAVTGRLTFDETKLPVTNWDKQENTPPLTKIKARIKGKVLGQAGFQNRFNKALTIELKCYGPWCAGGASGKQVLAFLKQSASGYSLSMTPCGDHVFYELSTADLNTVKDCYLNRNCPEPNQH